METNNVFENIVRFFEGGEGGEAGGAAGGGANGDASGGGDAGAGGAGGELPSGAFYGDERFRDALPEDIRGHAGLAKIANVEGLARSYLNTQKLVGKDPSMLVELPAAGDNDALRGVLSKLGLPDAVDGYTLEAPDGTPENLGPKGALGEGFVKAAHEAGILPGQAQAVYNWFAGEMSNVATNRETELAAKADENVRALEGQWGQAFDKNTALANHAIDKNGGEELQQILFDAGIDTHPLVMNLLAKHGEMIAENSGEGGEGSGSGANRFGNAMTPDQARSEARALLAEGNQLPMNDPRKKEIAARANRLYEIANKGAA